MRLLTIVADETRARFEEHKVCLWLFANLSSAHHTGLFVLQRQAELLAQERDRLQHDISKVQPVLSGGRSQTHCVVLLSPRARSGSTSGRAWS